MDYEYINNVIIGVTRGLVMCACLKYLFIGVG